MSFALVGYESSSYLHYCIKDNNKWSIRVMQHDGSPGFVSVAPRIIVDKHIELNDIDAKKLEKFLEATEPWKDSRIDDTSGRTDGDVILFEVAKKDQYNIFYRIGHTLRNDEKALFHILMELSGDQINDQWKSFRQIK